MKEKEIYNVNFLLSNIDSELNDSSTNQLVDSFINIYVISLANIRNVSGLNISPRHHFIEEFANFIDNLDEIKEYIAKGCKGLPMIISGIRAINTFDQSQLPIFINNNIRYIDENVASFEVNEYPSLDDNAVYEKLNQSEFEIVDYGTIKGAEKVKVLVPKHL